MPKQSKSKPEATETTSLVNTTVAPVAEKSAKSSKQTKPREVKAKSDAVSQSTSVVEQVSSVSTVPSVSSVPSVSTVPDVVDNEANDILVQSTEFFAKLNQMSSHFASLKTEFRSLEKKWSRELKVAQKSQAKRKRKSGNRQPSGFVKPTKISDELAKFLEKPTGTEMARTDVTREINTYIRAHKLQDKDNGRKINPDAKLAALLKLKKTDELTYFNLQRYMSPHFFKSEKALAVAAVTVNA
jgi:chromatin remodeling complex protein RSC6